jgi:hypothetical protein
LIWGYNWHIFKPDNCKPEDDEYPLHVLIEQVSYSGPFPLKYQEIADLERLQVMHYGAGFYINENSLRKQFMILADPEIPKDDKTFICRLMIRGSGQRLRSCSRINGFATNDNGGTV